MDPKSFLEWANNGAAPVVPTPASGGEPLAPKVNVGAWLTEHGIDVQGPKEEADGKKIYALKCPWSDPDCQKDWPTFLVQFPDGGVTGGCHHKSCLDKSWRDIRWAYEELPEPTAEEEQEFEDAIWGRAREYESLFPWALDVVRALRSMDVGALTALLSESVFVYDDQGGIAWIGDDAVLREPERGYAEWLIDKALEPSGEGSTVNLPEDLPDFPRLAVWKKYSMNEEEKIMPPVYGNIRKALVDIGAQLYYDEFADKFIVLGIPGIGPDVNNAAYKRMHRLIQEQLGFLPPWQQFQNTIDDMCTENSFHPVKRMFDSLPVWDGIDYVSTVWTRFCGVVDEPHIRAAARCFCTAMVKRIYEPGSFWGRIPVLEGKQGASKSTFFRNFVPRPAWFTDACPIHAGDKELIEATRGKWLCELAELSSLSRAEANHLKLQITKCGDSAREAYERRRTDLPRAWVMVGTTNERGGYLDDPTGAVRWQPMVTSGDMKVSEFVAIRDQFWAQCLAMYRAGESTELAREHWEAWGVAQESRSVEDRWHLKLSNCLPADGGNVEPEEIYKLLGLPVEKTGQKDSRRVAQIMIKLGWERVKRRRGKTTTNVWSTPGERGLILPWYRCETSNPGPSQSTELVPDVVQEGQAF